MVIPVGVLDAVFTAGAALARRIVLATENAQTAIVAQLDAVLVQTFLALLADDTAFLAVEIIEGADVVGAVAVAAKLLLLVHYTFAAAKTVPAFVDIARLTGHAIQTENSFLKACAALIAVGCDKTFGIVIINTARAAHAAAPTVVMVMTTVPALHTILVVCVDLSRQNAPEHREAHEDTANPYCKLVFHICSSLFSGPDRDIFHGIP